MRNPRFEAQILSSKINVWKRGKGTITYLQDSDKVVIEPIEIATVINKKLSLPCKLVNYPVIMILQQPIV